MYKIRFESENYFFYLNNLEIKEEYLDKNKIKELVEALDNCFNFKVTEILYIDNFSGIPEKYYNFNYSSPLPDDNDSVEVITYKFVYISTVFLYTNEFENIVGGFKNSKFHDEKNIQTLTDLYNKFFTCRMDLTLKKIKRHSYSSFESLKYRKKRKIGKQWGLSHQNAYGSKIEELLGEELKKLNIAFKTQQKIFGGSNLLTVPDFYIEEIKLVIYCDGYKYHYDKDTVIKDRQQDRRLQYMGYKVLRFTGSEIVGNVNQCASEIQFFINKFKSQ